MLGGRRKLPVLAEISGLPPEGARVWSLRRADVEALAGVSGDLAGHRAVLVCGGEAQVAAIALAAAASAGGRRVALVECDLARPRLATELGLAPAPGLHEYLRWEAEAAQILQPLALAGPAAGATAGPLICVVAGRAATDAITLAGLESFRHAIAKLRSAYDLTILLGPPPEITAGPLEAVAIQADAVLAAAPSAGLSGQPGRLLRAQLRRLRAKVLGAIAVEGELAQRS